MTRFLTDEELKRISAAIAAAEQHTAAEFVVATLTSASSYAGWWIGVAAALGWSAAVLLCVAGHVDAPYVLLGLQLLMTAAFGALLWPPAIRVWAVPAWAEARAIEGAARRLFVERGAHATRGHTGVMILLCRAERRVFLFGDVAAHRVLGDEQWRREAQALSAEWKSLGAADAVVRCVGRLSEHLRGSLPRTLGAVNELDNSVVDGSAAQT